jgi:hypothetical protein
VRAKKKNEAEKEIKCEFRDFVNSAPLSVIAKMYSSMYPELL